MLLDVVIYNSSWSKQDFASSSVDISLFAGVLLSLYCVCCLHHAALLHEMGHYRQWHNLPLAHCHPQRLSDFHCHRTGASNLAGKPFDMRGNHTTEISISLVLSASAAHVT